MTISRKIISLWCEKCKKETLHKEIGWGEHKGEMYQWFSCEVDTCYNEKVIAEGVQVKEGVYLKARILSAPEPKRSFLDTILEAFTRR